MSTGGRFPGRVGHLPAVAVMRLLNNLAIGWIESNLFCWRISARTIAGCPPKDFASRSIMSEDPYGESRMRGKTPE